MSLHPECVPCIMKQALNTATVSNVNNNAERFEILRRVYCEIQNVNDDFTAPGFSKIIQNIVRSFSKIEDPYKETKIQNTKRALQYIPYLRTYIESSADKLEKAIRVAILGNIIDVGANPDFNLEDEVGKISSTNIVLDDYTFFEKDLKNADYILYIGDNAEEAVFDKLLIEQLAPRKVIFAVREAPVLNDITIDFARGLGMDSVSEIISSGSSIPGTDMNAVSEKFKHLFYNAPMVIAKGQGNYETLLNEQRPIYFLFKVKCSVIAEMCRKPIGTSMLYYNKKNNVL
ncbi:MAG TPA: hypothetical protein DCQ28_15070 [Bacteroidetes bacterium]|nr:hypothetical protein [Bacteroidota bacterium]